ncbi:hypothetical protein MMC21_000295 [Puttea exsequens]|nr:hypothetical protein [Puttea exsequens]
MGPSLAISRAILPQTPAFVAGLGGVVSQTVSASIEKAHRSQKYVFLLLPLRLLLGKHSHAKRAFLLTLTAKGGNEDQTLIHNCAGSGDGDTNDWCCAGVQGTTGQGQDCCSTNATTSLDSYPYSTITVITSISNSSTATFKTTTSPSSSSGSVASRSSSLGTTSSTAAVPTGTSTLAPATPTNTPQTSNNHAATIGAAVGVPLGLLLLAGIAFLVYRDRKNDKRIRALQATAPRKEISEQDPEEFRRAYNENYELPTGLDRVRVGNGTSATVTAINSSQSSGHSVNQSFSIDEHIADSTVGILVLSLSDRSERRDALSLAATFSSLMLFFFDAIKGSSMDTKAWSPHWNNKLNHSLGELGCWRSHLNAIQHVIDTDLSTALTIEDDSDWDVNIKPQLQRFSGAAPSLQSAHHQASPWNEIPAPSPYSDRCDLLWLGACGSPQGPSEVESFLGEGAEWPNLVHDVAGRVAAGCG